VKAFGCGKVAGCWASEWPDADTAKIPARDPLSALPNSRPKPAILRTDVLPPCRAATLSGGGQRIGVRRGVGAPRDWLPLRRVRQRALESILSDASQRARLDAPGDGARLADRIVRFRTSTIVVVGKAVYVPANAENGDKGQRFTTALVVVAAMVVPLLERRARASRPMVCGT
jgi:hypothetical protein